MHNFTLEVLEKDPPVDKSSGTRESGTHRVFEPATNEVWVLTGGPNNAVRAQTAQRATVLHIKNLDSVA